jgi:hypothetical protein
MTARLGLALAITLSLTAPLAAQVPTVIVNDTFDTYADQAAFEAAWPRWEGGAGIPAGAPSTLLPSGTLSTEQAKSPTQSIRIQADPAAVPPVFNASENSQRNQFTLPQTTGLPAADNVIKFSFDFYDVLTGGANGNPFRQSASMQMAAGTGNAQTIAMGLHNNLIASQDGGNFYMARIVGFTPTFLPPTGATPNPAPTAGAFFKLNDVGAPARSQGWHNLAVTIDDLNFKFYVDGVLSKTIANTFTPREYDALRIGSGFSSANSIAYYDNVTVELNPAPILPTFNADFDSNGVVDGKDFLTWQRNFGAVGQISKVNGDADGDGNVNDADLTLWKTSFGGPPPAVGGAIAAVPEPASMAMAAVALVAGFAAARRRS